MNSPSNRVDMGGIEYPSWETLEEPKETYCMLDPHVLLNTLIKDLECVDEWKVQYECLTELQRIAKFKPHLLLADISSGAGDVAPHPTVTFVEKISEPILACLSSLRSALSKNAMLTIAAFMRGLGGDYIRTLASLHTHKTSPQRGPRPIQKYAKLEAVVSILLQKASSTAEKKFIQSSAEETLTLLASQPKGAEPLLCVILKIMKESKNSRIIGACGQTVLKCWHHLSNEWMEGTDRECMENVISLVSQSIPILLADKNPTSRAAVKKLTEEMRSYAARIDQQSDVKLPLPDRNMSTHLNNVWGSMNTTITSPSMRMSVSKFLGLSSSSSNLSAMGHTSALSASRSDYHKASSTESACAARQARSPPQQRRQASLSSQVRSPDRAASSARGLPKPTSSMNKPRQSSHTNTSSGTRHNVANHITSMNQLRSPVDPPVAATRVLRSHSSQPRTSAVKRHPVTPNKVFQSTFALPTRSSHLPTPSQSFTTATQRPVPRSRTLATEWSKASSAQLPKSNADYLMQDRGRPSTATLPLMMSKRPPTQLPRGRKAVDENLSGSLGQYKFDSQAALPPKGRSAILSTQKPPLLSGRPISVPSLSCSYQDSSILSADSSIYGRGSSGGLMEKSVTTLSTATSLNGDRATTTSAGASAAGVTNHSARDRSRSLSNRLRILSSRRSLSVNGRPTQAPPPPPGPFTLPPWLMIDDDSTED